MAFTEYKLFFVSGVGGTIPEYIKTGGYFQDPDSGSMIGWYSTKNIKFDYEGQKDIVEITLNQMIERQLEIHQKYPMTTSSEEGEMGSRVMTEQEVIDYVTNTYNWIVQENISTNPTAEDLAEVKSDKLKQAFKYMEKMLDNEVVSLPIASVGANCTFGCDKTTQENIIGINTAIARGVNIPNPTYWTPKNSGEAVIVTHNELANIGGSILVKKNDYYAIYFVHKSNIINATDYEYVVRYDFTTGY